MGAIFYREIKAYFSSLLAWSLVAAFLVVIGMFMCIGIAYYADISASSMQGGAPCNINTVLIPGVVQSIAYIFMFFAPLLTMRSFSEDKSRGTLDLLFTYPISDWEIVLGKFFAVLMVVIMMLAFSSLGLLFVGTYCTIEWPVILCGYLGIFLMCASLTAMGVFASSLSSSQLISASMSYGLTFVLWLLTYYDQKESHTGLVFGKLSVLSHMEYLSKGVFNSQDVCYYIALTFFFLYLTVRFLESRKWKG
ncbi:ABC transporter permease subunit [bacterium]|nr:ABC transporter permease subunit [bacterium]